MKNVEIHTDGACSGNPGPGGYGYLIQYQNHIIEEHGYALETTNNRMELQAAISSLERLKTPCKVNLYSDSKYLVQGMKSWITQWQKNNWLGSNKKLVKNKDLWYNLLKQDEKHDVTWIWVKGHANNSGNIKADELANIGLKIAKSQIIG